MQMKRSKKRKLGKDKEGLGNEKMGMNRKGRRKKNVQDLEREGCKEEERE